MTILVPPARLGEPTGPGTVSAPFPGAATDQPYAYTYRALLEPDWRRFTSWRDVTTAQWRDAQWQRAHCVKNVAQLRAVWGTSVPAEFYADLAADQAQRATMSILITPQMINTIDETKVATDPVRRYMLPVLSDRDARWPGHPYSARDSLHEAEMWAVEGLTHRYPTKVLAELLSTCPQYCGHCTRMDLVGNSTATVAKLKFETKPVDRQDAMIDYLRRSPGVRDVVVSGGDVANLPIKGLEAFVSRLLEIDTIRDIRLATKALMGLPQHWLHDDVLAGVARLAQTARSRGVSLAVHTHVNAAQQVTPLVAEATAALFEAGVRDVRNQGVLLRGVNASPGQLLDLCFALLDGAGILPYYFYMCDLIPNAEHWRVALWEAQGLQHSIMGYLPGFATPRLVCDVPYVGKRWVHQCDSYDRDRGISYWTKNYRTGIEHTDPAALTRRYEYYDPISTLPASGQAWWGQQTAAVADDGR